MDTDIIDTLRLVKDLLEILDSISLTDDISEDLSDAIYDAQEPLENLVSALEKEAIGK